MTTSNYADESNRGSIRRSAWCLFVLGTLTTLCPGAALAAPIVAPNSNNTFSTPTNTLTITKSPNAIINWNSFSINSGQTTNFVQPSGSRPVLTNRVTGPSPAAIISTLQSNGKVYLINPNGILTPGSPIGISGLTTTQNATSDASRFRFTANDGQKKNTNAIPGESRKTVTVIDPKNPEIAVVTNTANINATVARGNKAGIFGALVNQNDHNSASNAVRNENGRIFFTSRESASNRTAAPPAETAISRSPAVADAMKASVAATKSAHPFPEGAPAVGTMNRAGTTTGIPDVIIVNHKE